MISRRTFFKGAAVGGAVLAVAPMSLLTGCDVQDELVGLLSELQTTWQAFATASGTTIPTPVQTAFADAIAAAKAWTVGSAAQSVVEALQLVSADVVPLIPILNSTEQALVQIVLGTIINLIEYFDPNATPVPAGQPTSSAHAAIIANARIAVIGGTQKGQKVSVSGLRKIKHEYEAKVKALKKAA